MEPSYILSFLKMIFALAFVLGIMLGAAYLLKRLSGPSMSATGQGGHIQVVSTRFMGPKTSIMIIDCLGHILVVGVTPTAVNLLAEITDPDTVKRLKHGVQPGSMQSSVPGGTAPLESLLEAIRKRLPR